MNSKQRRAERRRVRRIRKLEDLADAIVYSEKRMNDFCPQMYEKCGDPNKVFNFDCFGNYYNCPYRKV